MTSVPLCQEGRNRSLFRLMKIIVQIVSRCLEWAEALATKGERSVFVRMWMTQDVITVPPDMPILGARDAMKQGMLRRLPVVKKNKLLGLITQGDIQEAGPSGATSLSIWELNYLLARITVDEVMTKAEELITVSPRDYHGVRHLWRLDRSTGD